MKDQTLFFPTSSSSHSDSDPQSKSSQIGFLWLSLCWACEENLLFGLRSSDDQLETAQVDDQAEKELAKFEILAESKDEDVPVSDADMKAYIKSL